MTSLLSSDTFYLVMAIVATIAIPVLFAMNVRKELQMQRERKAQRNGIS